MDAFLSAHADKITGVLSLFDRILIKGHLPLGYPQGMEKLLLRHGKLFKDLKGLESLEILAACVRPDAFPEFLRSHAASMRRVTPELALEPCFPG